MTVNKGNINALADFMEAHTELPFNMMSVETAQCGTAGCVAGFAGALWEDVRHKDSFDWAEDFVMAKMGLDQDTGDNLFYPKPLQREGIPYSEFTRQGAISTLRRLAETGEVVWKRSEQV